MSLKILLTGASGYLGSIIKHYLQDKGMTIYELKHRWTEQDDGNKFIIKYSLGKELNLEIFQGMDAFIHCAYDFKVNKWNEIYDVNVKGSINLFYQAQSAGIKKMIFISSMSAFEGCKSLYGQAKLRVEQEVLKMGGLVIRPGLIYGSHAKGMFGALMKLIKVFKVIPLVGSGDQIQFLVHEDDLSKLILNLCLENTNNIKFPIIAASEKKMTLKEILVTIAKSQEKQIYFFPIPARLIFLALKSIEILGIRIRLRSDSLLSLINSNITPDFKINKHLRINYRSFRIETLRDNKSVAD